MPPSDADALRDRLRAAAARREADLYVYSGDLTREGALALTDEVDRSHGRPACLLALTTYGGDPHAAYLLARFLRRAYLRVTVLVGGMCKSAGTLLVLGADEVVMDARGELGPLDIQLPHEDRPDEYHSGLDVLQLFRTLGTQGAQVFLRHFEEVRAGTAGTISTGAAVAVAREMTVSFLAPLTARMDPLRIGGTQRAMLIATEYGRRLAGDDCPALEPLVAAYPDHAFVIDVEEASGLLETVRRPDAADGALLGLLRAYLATIHGEDPLRTPHSQGLVLCLTTKPRTEGSDAIERTGRADAGGDGRERVPAPPRPEAVGDHERVLASDVEPAPVPAGAGRAGVVPAGRVGPAR